MENALKSNERQKIYVHKTLKIEIQKEDQIIQTLENWCLPAIKFPLFNL